MYDLKLTMLTMKIEFTERSKSARNKLLIFARVIRRLKESSSSCVNLADGPRERICEAL